MFCPIFVVFNLVSSEPNMSFNNTITNKQTITTKIYNELTIITISLVKLRFLGRNGIPRLSLLSSTSVWSYHVGRWDGLQAMFSKKAVEMFVSQNFRVYHSVRRFSIEKLRWELSRLATLFICITLSSDDSFLVR
jgi:hypothetical protein